MNFSIYFAITAVITAFFIFSYIKFRRPFQLAFAIWVPSTLLQYVSNNRVYTNILNIVELILFLLTMVLFVKEQKKRKKQEQEETEE